MEVTLQQKLRQVIEKLRDVAPEKPEPLASCIAAVIELQDEILRAESKNLEDIELNVRSMDELRLQFSNPENSLAFVPVYFWDYFDEFVLALDGIPVTKDNLKLFHAAVHLVEIREREEKTYKWPEVPINPEFWRYFEEVLDFVNKKEEPKVQRQALETVAQLEKEGLNNRQIGLALNLSSEQLERERAEPGSVIGKPGWKDPRDLAEENEPTLAEQWPRVGVITNEAAKLKARREQGERDRQQLRKPKETYLGASELRNMKTQAQTNREARRESYQPLYTE